MTLLRVRDLHVAFASDRGMVGAVQGISFDLDEGEVLGVVGESGSGKSVAALSIMRMIPQPPGRVSATELTLDGEDLLGLSEARARASVRFSLSRLNTEAEVYAALQLVPTAVARLRELAPKARRASSQLATVLTDTRVCPRR